jgi:glycosyltransferase involved in cell wall biosynthesis
MRVILSAGKRGHYYMTAYALQEAGLLARFITSTFFPKRSWRRRVFPRASVAVRSDPRLDDDRVVSLWPIEMAYRFVRPLLGRFWRQGMRAYNALHDLASISYLRGADVLHVANTYGDRSGPAAHRRGMKVVVDQQSVHPGYSMEILRSECERLDAWDVDADPELARRVVRELELADLILAPSLFVFEENVRHGIPADKQRIVPFGVDTSLFTPTTRRRRRNDPFRILFAGRLSVQKGVPYLLDAVRRLSDPRIELTLVGRVAADMEAILADHHGSYRRLEPLKHDRLAQLYGESDCLCLPSLAEGSALVTYEAMASALPCVLTRSAGSLVEHGVTGLIVPIRSADALAEALLALADDPERAVEMGQRARTVACAHDLRGYGARLLAAYRDYFGRDACAPSR